MKKVLGIFVAGFLFGCTASQGYIPSQISENDTVLMERAFVASLADPQSVQTRDVAVFESANGNRLICGVLNAKNGFGGFIGFQPFEVMIVSSIDYSKPYVRPIFATGGAARLDCSGAGYISAI